MVSAGRHRIKEEDRPQRTPNGVVQLLARMATAGEHIGQLCKLMHAQQGELAVRRIQGILSFTKKYGIARVEDACAAALELAVIDYRFVRRYLERNTQPPISLRQVDPLIRQPNLYRPYRRKNQGRTTIMNITELQNALHQLRLGGIAHTLETRLRQAQVEPMAPIDLLSCLISDELTTRADRLLERRRKQAAFRDPHRTLDNFDFAFNPKMNRSLVFDLATGNFIAKHEDALFLGPGGTGKSHLAQAIGQSAIVQGYRVHYREAHVLLDDLVDAAAAGERKQFMTSLAGGAVAHHLRLRDAQAAAHGRRGSTRNRHAPLRTREHIVDFESSSGGLGQSTRR